MLHCLLIEVQECHQPFNEEHFEGLLVAKDCVARLLAVDSFQALEVAVDWTHLPTAVSYVRALNRISSS